jgi:hypothetical protein
MNPQTTFVLLSLCACGHSSQGAFGAIDGSAGDAAGTRDAPGGDVATTGNDASSGTPEASTTAEAGADADEAGAVASLCVGLGGSCKDSTTCLCGVGSACTFDNVDCTAGVCAVSFDVPLDAGEECCAMCQSTYDSCKASGNECLSQWTTCNGACPGECPVLCLAAQGMPGGA